MRDRAHGRVLDVPYMCGVLLGLCFFVSCAFFQFESNSISLLILASNLDGTERDREVKLFDAQDKREREWDVQDEVGPLLASVCSFSLC